jgi:hypothetical protein
MISDLAEPLEAWQWDIRSSRLARYEFPWPGDMPRGTKSDALDVWGFELELVASPAAHETGVQATVYSRFLPEDEKAMPFHYCIVLEMNTFSELVFAADLPELVDTLRYLEPIIKN